MNEDYKWVPLPLPLGSVDICEWCSNTPQVYKRALHCSIILFVGEKCWGNTNKLHWLFAQRVKAVRTPRTAKQKNKPATKKSAKAESQPITEQHESEDKIGEQVEQE